MSLLTENEQTLFKLQSKVYCYVPWSIPAGWESGYSKLAFYPLWKYPVVVLMYTALVLYGLLSGYIAVLYGWLSPRPDFTVTQCLILGLACIPACLYTMTLINLFQEILAIAYNQFLMLSNQLQDELPTDWNTQDQIKVFTIIPVLASPAFPWLIGFGCVFSNMDCMYYLQELIFPDNYNKSIRTILPCILFRFAWSFLLVLEICRTFMFLYCCLLIIVTRMSKVLKIITARLRDFHRFRLYYLQICLLYIKMKTILEIFVYLTLSSLFWVMVALIWIVVMCPMEKLSMPLYILVCCVLVFTILGHAFFLPIVCDTIELCRIAITIHSLRIKFQFARQPTRQGRIMKTQAKSLRPIHLMYGRFYRIEDGFVKEYFEALLLRALDAVLMT